MRRSALLGCLMCAVVAPPPPSGQPAVLLRYRPSPGNIVRTVSTTAYTIGRDRRQQPHPADITPPDSLIARIDLLQSVAERVVQGGTSLYTIERTLDSVRLSLERNGIVRTNLPDPARRASARLLVTGRLEIRDVRVVAPADFVSFARAALRAPAGGYAFTLPAGAVRPGDRWTAAVQYPFVIPGGEDASAGVVAADTVVTTDGRFVLDSLVPRGADTLVYLSVVGRFAPFAAPLPTTGWMAPQAIPTPLAGGFAGSVIWSTAWSTWASGVFRTTIYDVGTSEPNGRLVIGALTHFGIRP